MNAAVTQGAGAPRQPLVRWDWVADHLDDVWARLLEHVQLTAIAVGVGLVIATLLAVIVLRWRRAYAPLLGITGALYTVPSVAMFALLVPAWGLSVLTAEVALVSYTLLILLRNIVLGIDGVPTAVVEAARGMGYRPRRLFLEIQLPLALPVIIAGIRIATVTVIGLVTVTELIGLGGLGAFFRDGLNRSIRFSTPIVVGVVLVVALAVVADVILLLVQRIVTPWARRRATA